MMKFELFVERGGRLFFCAMSTIQTAKKKQEKSDNHLFNMLYGLGFWHQDDNDYLKTFTGIP
ncbi:MAG: hypothetical protein H8E62_09455 [Planctomycetes bacterium]|nr:hypothetical protein [Planctomycetota bacterium]